MACQEGHCEVALLLLANGADVNASDMVFNKHVILYLKLNF